MPQTPLATVPTQGSEPGATRPSRLRGLPTLVVVEARPEPPEHEHPGVEWSVGAVAERLEVPTATLRSWDRRYGVGPSHHSAGGHRRYTEQDVHRVAAMQGYVALGVPVLTAARVARALDVRDLPGASSSG